MTNNGALFMNSLYIAFCKLYSVYYELRKPVLGGELSIKTQKTWFISIPLCPPFFLVIDEQSFILQKNNNQLYRTCPESHVFCHSGLSGIFPMASGRIPDTLHSLKAPGGAGMTNICSLWTYSIIDSGECQFH